MVHTKTFNLNIFINVTFERKTKGMRPLDDQQTLHDSDWIEVRKCKMNQV